MGTPAYFEAVLMIKELNNIHSRTNTLLLSLGEYMIVNKIAWLTDVHLNFLQDDGRKKFYQFIDQQECEAIVITGDIAEATSICGILHEFSEHTDKVIYFVLGNHDYYFGSVIDVRANIEKLCSNNSRLVWLGKPEIVLLNDSTVLIGHDGWADGRYGNFDQSPVSLNDSRLILELHLAKTVNRSGLKNAMQSLADADAKVLKNTLMASKNLNVKKIIIATHVPPYPECCLHQGKQSDEDWLPYFSSKATGDVISEFALNNPKINLFVLCGHTHSPALYKPFENLVVKGGKADYYRPELQEIIHI